ncbi:MAG: ISL3 family transposase [Planctomycetota bacterium]
MPDIDRITAILGFQRYQVVRFKRFNKQWIELRLELRDRNLRCPGCGQRFVFSYDRRYAAIRDLDLSTHRTVLSVPKYRVRCPRCGVRQVHLEIARPHARCTKRFEKWLFVLTRTMPITEAADLMAVHWATVRDAEIRYIRGFLRKRNLDGIRDLGVDEVSEKKGHRYLTLVTDLALRRVIWVGRGNDGAVLRRFFRWFGPKRTRRIRRVVMDMHLPYEYEVRRQCPRARIVYDRFHLMKLLHRALDDLRRRLQRELPPEGRRYLKDKRYLLLRAKENLTTKQQVRLDELLAVNQPLNAAYILKEDFRALFDEENPKRARQDIKDWKVRARESELPELLEFVKMLNRRRYGILNFFRHRITNGLAEGLNNVVKTIKKVACGFHDWEYFALKILRRCGRIERGVSDADLL